MTPGTTPLPETNGPASAATNDAGSAQDSPNGGANLVVVATPIGNLNDLSPRAVATLAGSDVIACEDTRRTRRLLTHAGISGKRLVSLFAANEQTRTPQIIEALAHGNQVALVSDAGTPGISDPGCMLVDAVASAGFTVSVVPGPSALTASLAVSGIPHDRFCFEGFLPRKGSRRRSRLRLLSADKRASVIFEAPSRLVGTLEDISAAFGPTRRVTVARELTKTFEDVWRGEANEVLDQARDRADAGLLRGECVIVIAGDRRRRGSDNDPV